MPAFAAPMALEQTDLEHLMQTEEMVSSAPPTRSIRVKAMKLVACAGAAAALAFGAAVLSGEGANAAGVVTYKGMQLRPSIIGLASAKPEACSWASETMMPQDMLDSKGGIVGPTTVMFDLQCQLRCRNTTGCEYYTFYPAPSFFNCHVTGKDSKRMTVMSVGSGVGSITPTAGRLCSVGELAGHALTATVEGATANLSTAYENCLEPEVAYSPYKEFNYGKNLSECRDWCLEVPDCKAWTHWAGTRMCNIASNATGYLNPLKSRKVTLMLGATSSLQSCDMRAFKKAKKEEERKENGLFGFKKRGFFGLKKTDAPTTPVPTTTQKKYMWGPQR